MRKHYPGGPGRLHRRRPVRATSRRERPRTASSAAKPGSYGAGILPLIDERNWQDDADFAEAYVNWGGYAYTADEQGIDARDAVPHAAVRRAGRAAQPGQPRARHLRQRRLPAVPRRHDRHHPRADRPQAAALLRRHPRPVAPASATCKEEALRVFRTRVVNPKWIDGISATATRAGWNWPRPSITCSATTPPRSVVDDWMYEQVAQTYALDPRMQEFLEKSNPWALHAIAERLLEAEHRGMWLEPDPATIEALCQALVDSETMLEARAETRAQEARV